MYPIVPINPTPPLDRLSDLLEHHRVRARLFHEGPLCGLHPFPEEAGRGFLHVLRAGTLRVRHPRGSGVPEQLELTEPGVLFYPRALQHEIETPASGSDFVCASLAFEGGDAHPLVRALPGVVMVPLRDIAGLQDSLRLLFMETEQVRCGQRLLADRLFEVVLLQLLRWLIDHAPAHTGLLAGLADPALARALTAMHREPGRVWTLAALATQAGMSRSRFSARFHRIVGLPPAAYLSQWRIGLACRGLRRGKTLEVLAHQLGYASHASLSRAFRQTLGLAPRQWLQQQRRSGQD